MVTGRATSSRISDGDDLLALYLREIGNIPTPTREEQTELAKRVQAGDQFARQDMIAANLKLVIGWAAKYQGQGIEITDLIQEATFGLIRAVEKYEWEKGYAFSTYAVGWIRKTLQSAVYNKARTIRVPLQVGLDSQAIETAQNDLTHELGRTPTIPEICEATSFSEDRIMRARSIPFVTMSLDAKLGGDNSTSLNSMIGDNTSQFDDEMEAEMEIQAIRSIIVRLPPNDREMINLMFGLSGRKSSSSRNICRQFKLTPEQLSERQSKILAVIRNQLIENY